MKRKPSKLFEFGELMRNASIAAYDINRSIQKLAKANPEEAGRYEQEAIAGLLRRIEGFSSAPVQR